MLPLTVDTTSGPKILEFQRGEITLVVGPNGVGKSAFLYQIYRSQPVGGAEYYPGHRQLYFNHGWENSHLSENDLSQNLYSQVNAFNRYKGQFTEDQFKSVLRKITNLESSFNREMIESIRENPDHAVGLKFRNSPLDKLNKVFAAAGLPISFTFGRNGLQARREESEYSIDQLSDGERAALLLTGSIISKPSGLIIFDEPERHIHPSISAPLIEHAVRITPNRSYLFSTHDINLTETLHVDRVIYINNSKMISKDPEMRTFDLRVVEDVKSISNTLRRAVLGARGKVLFVEGDEASLDMALYRMFYKDWKVVPSGSGHKVVESVRALRSNDKLHWVQCAGIIDGDGLLESEKTRMRDDAIFPLPVSSIENLFFLPSVIRGVAHVLTSLEGGCADKRIATVQESLTTMAPNDLEEIIARRAAWLIQRAVSKTVPSVKTIRLGIDSIETVNIVEIVRQVRKDLECWALNLESLKDIAVHPIKQTGIPETISKAVGAKNSQQYKQIVLTQIENEGKTGLEIADAIRTLLPVIDNKSEHLSGTGA